MILRVRGDVIQIPDFVVQQIPFTSALSSSEEKDILDIDTISPRFFTLIVEYLKNGQKLSFLRSVLEREFDQENIKIYLKYLGMDDIYNKLYKYNPPNCNVITICVKGKEIDFPLSLLDRFPGIKKLVLDDSTQSTDLDGNKIIKYKDQMIFMGDMCPYFLKILIKGYHSAQYYDSIADKIKKRCDPSDVKIYFKSLEFDNAEIEKLFASHYTIKTKGELVRIPKCIIDYFPLLKAMFVDTMSNHIDNDTIPPEFLKIIIEGHQNAQLRGYIIGKIKKKFVKVEYDKYLNILGIGDVKKYL